MMEVINLRERPHLYRLLMELALVVGRKVLLVVVVVPREVVGVGRPLSMVLEVGADVEVNVVVVVVVVVVVQQ